MHGRNTNVLTAQLDLQISKDLRKLANHEAMDTRHRQSQIRHRQDKHKQSIKYGKKAMKGKKRNNRSRERQCSDTVK